jgi:hypothetical protein
MLTGTHPNWGVDLVCVTDIGAWWYLSMGMDLGLCPFFVSVARIPGYKKYQDNVPEDY